MSTWFYYDNNGQKQGPITGGRLKGLAKAGLISPETKIETEDGKTARAGKVKGLTFLDPTLPAPASPEPTPSNVAPLTEAGSSSVTFTEGDNPFDSKIFPFTRAEQNTQTHSPVPFPFFTETEMAAMQTQPVSNNQPPQQQQSSQYGSGTNGFAQAKKWVSNKYVLYGIGTLIGIAAMIFSFIGSSPVGAWKQEGNSSLGPITMELNKDGTGYWDGRPMTWTREIEKVGRRSYAHSLHLNTKDGRLEGEWNYTISGSVLTLRSVQGTLTYKKQKSELTEATVQEETAKDDAADGEQLQLMETPQQQQMREASKRQMKEMQDRHEQRLRELQKRIQKK